MLQRTGVEFNFDQAVKAIGVTPERLEKMIEEGQITAYREGVTYMIPRSAILEYLRGVTSIGKRTK